MQHRCKLLKLIHRRIIKADKTVQLLVDHQGRLQIALDILGRHDGVFLRIAFPDRLNITDGHGLPAFQIRQPAADATDVHVLQVLDLGFHPCPAPLIGIAHLGAVKQKDIDAVCLQISTQVLKDLVDTGFQFFRPVQDLNILQQFLLQLQDILLGRTFLIQRGHIKGNFQHGRMPLIGKGDIFKNAFVMHTQVLKAPVPGLPQLEQRDAAKLTGSRESLNQIVAFPAPVFPYLEPLSESLVHE